MSRAEARAESAADRAAATGPSPELGLSPAQESLRADLRAFLESGSAGIEDLHPSDARPDRRAYELWHALGERGWLSLGRAERGGEAQGPLQGGLLEIAIACFEIGRRARPIPFRTGAVECIGALARLASESQRNASLPDLLAGRRRFSLALLEALSLAAPEGIQLRAERSGGSYVLHGRKRGVEFGRTAIGFAVAVRTQQTPDPAQGISLLLVPADLVGVVCNPAVSSDPMGNIDLSFDGVHVPESSRVGAEGAAWPVLEQVLLHSQVALCAEAAGGARGALELATAHALRRVQWERPIGSFQALQHLLADALVDADAAELACFEAAASADAGLAFSSLARSASIVCSEAYRRNAARAHQLLGGAGVLADSELPLHTRRAAAIAQKFGGVEAQRQLLARELGL